MDLLFHSFSLEAYGVKLKKKNYNHFQAIVMKICFILPLERRRTADSPNLSSLCDGGKLSLMKGDNNPAGINLPRLWLLFLRNVNTYPVTP